MTRPGARVAVSIAVVVAGIAAVLLLASRSLDAPATGAPPAPTVPAASPADAQVVRPDSHVLGDPADGSVVVAEFLDFECEACGAWYPAIERLRKQYEGRVRFVHRYFPLPGHSNAKNAALAAEAAAQQGAYEAMYQKLFETQLEWGESQDSQATLFRTYADQLGLDMSAYDAAVASQQTFSRVEQDVADGVALGVQGTPTFFLNGQRIQPTGPADFAAAIDSALAGGG
jgi:protein-disulfide isomerase